MVARKNNLRVLFFIKRKQQKELAKFLGVSRMAVWNWCENIYTFQKHHEEKIAEFFGVNVDQLYAATTPFLSITIDHNGQPVDKK